MTGAFRVGSEYMSRLLSQINSLSSSMYSVNLYRHLEKSSGDWTDQAVANAVAMSLERNGIESNYADKVVNLILQDIGSGNTTRIYDRVMRFLFIRDEKISWAEKNQLVWEQLGEFTSELSSARGLLLLRNPVPAVSSFKRFTTHSGETFLGAAFCHLSAMQAARRFSDNKRIDVLLYEDWASKPMEAVAEIAEKLNLDFQSLPGAAGGLVSTTWQPSPNELSRDEVAFVSTICRDACKYLGYEIPGPTMKKSELYRMTNGNPYLNHLLFEWEATGVGSDRYPSEYLHVV